MEAKYDVLEKIGHGSFGVIRKVRRKTDGFVMCRKEISYIRMSAKEREQLHAEFQILSHLRHPNIVAYYHREHLKLSQDLHLYMEYCGNGDLGRVIKDLKNTGRRAPETFVWSILGQLVLALYRCHYGVDPPEVGTNVLGLTKGAVHGAPKVPPGTMTILHRDLKPENVFLDEDNSVKLGDFGLSKIIQSQDFASTYVGTPFYMSPEICAAENYTLKSDIWSMGCIIYELCSRDPPFTAKTHCQLVQKIKEGRTPPLPDMYSAELGNVIKDCLRVNPDRRPDTAQLLNLPAIKLIRKEKDVADLNKVLRARESALRSKERELNERLARVDREQAIAREELESTIRREWEVKARLEIDRLVQTETQRLIGQFETEVQARVEAELQRRGGAPAHTAAAFGEEHRAERERLESSIAARSDNQHSSIWTASGDDNSLATEVTDYSIESPDSSKEKEPKKAARTPFGRAQTMYVGAPAGTPMDVEMASPSPINIASLSLSPRRTGATKVPSRPEGNIFAANNGTEDPKWKMPSEPTLEESDEDDIIPSPTRQIKSSRNPFTSKSRPVLTSQKSCPTSGPKPKTSSGGLVSKVGLGAQPEPRPRSPTRRLSKIPSATNLAADREAQSHVLRRPASSKKLAEKDKAAGTNNIKGRTLVELQQARAGGRQVVGSEPTSGSENTTTNTSPKRRVATEYVALWDPETDEMPSPFLARTTGARTSQ